MLCLIARKLHCNILACAPFLACFIQRKYSQNSGTRHNDIQYNDTQHKGKLVILSINNSKQLITLNHSLSRLDIGKFYCENVCDYAKLFTPSPTCPSPLGKRDTDRISSICVA